MGQRNEFFTNKNTEAQRSTVIYSGIQKNNSSLTESEFILTHCPVFSLLYCFLMSDKMKAFFRITSIIQAHKNLGLRKDEKLFSQCKQLYL